MIYLVTGTAGFIGNAVALKLLQRGETVIGVDNLNDYYDVRLKQDRLKRICSSNGFIDERLDISDTESVANLFTRYCPNRVIHLAAQAGVRYSIENPHVYIDSNITGFLNILEGCRRNSVEHLTYASTSSVYGANKRQPFSERHRVDHPMSLYAATKRANELMAHTYSSLYQLPTTGLRFFTVYGPWGRPDMALFKFTESILNGQSIDVFNYGNHRRDFTYIDDIVEGVIRVADHPAIEDVSWDGLKPTTSTSYAPYRIYNIGNSRPIELMHYIRVLEKALERKATINLLPMQLGDVSDTYADVAELANEIGYRPTTSVEDGVCAFVQWYRNYYRR